jgi:hypothetical protein
MFSNDFVSVRKLFRRISDSSSDRARCRLPLQASRNVSFKYTRDLPQSAEEKQQVLTFFQ